VQALEQAGSDQSWHELRSVTLDKQICRTQANVIPLVNLHFRPAEQFRLRLQIQVAASHLQLDCNHCMSSMHTCETLVLQIERGRSWATKLPDTVYLSAMKWLTEFQVSSLFDELKSMRVVQFIEQLLHCLAQCQKPQKKL